MIVINVLMIIVSVFLIIVVLIQNAKGGGLVSNFSSTNQIMGVRKTTDVLEKATWVLAITLVALCIISTMILQGSSSTEQESHIKKESIEMAAPQVQLPENMTNASEVAQPNASAEVAE